MISRDVQSNNYYTTCKLLYVYFREQPESARENPENSVQYAGQHSLPPPSIDAQPFGISYNQDDHASPAEQTSHGSSSLFSQGVNQTVPKQWSIESVSSGSEAGASVSEPTSSSGISSGSSLRVPFGGEVSQQGSQVDTGHASATPSFSSQSSASTPTDRSRSEIRSQEYPDGDPRMALSAASVHQAESIQGLYHRPGENVHNAGAHINAQNISELLPSVSSDLSVFSLRSLPN